MLSAVLFNVQLFFYIVVSAVTPQVAKTYENTLRLCLRWCMAPYKRYINPGHTALSMLVISIVTFVNMTMFFFYSKHVSGSFLA